jgi:threonine dehydrogenase-like Zn-dependent dehydrogenase
MGVIGLNGGYAEYVVVPARFVHRLPGELDLKSATLCELLAVTIKGLRRLERAWGPGSTKRCAVVGAGSLGHLCARVLALRGHHVVVFDRNPTRLAYLAGSGIETVNDLCHLQEFDALVEATGDPQALHAMLHKSGGGATLLLLGLPYAKRKFSFESIVAYDKAIVGSVGSRPEDFEEAIALLPKLDLSHCAQKIVPLDAYDEAFAVTRTREYLKVLLEVDGRLADYAWSAQAGPDK